MEATEAKTAEQGMAITVQAVYDEARLKQMAENTARASYSAMASWQHRADFLMDVKALGMGYLEAISERDSARADNAWMKRDIDEVVDTLMPIFQSGKPYAHFGELGQHLVKGVPPLVQAYEAQSRDLERIRRDAQTAKAERDSIRAELDHVLTREADTHAALLERAEKAEKFKSYVHQRLDKMGVPANPEPATHALEGCRVGDRLDWVANQMPLCTSPVERRRIDNLEKSNESMKTRLHATRMTLAGLVDELSAATQQKT